MAERVLYPEPLLIWIRGGRFYLADFMELRDLLEKKCKEIRIRTKNYRYELAEIGEQKIEDRISELSIDTELPTIRIDLSKKRVSVYASGREDAGVGLAHVVASFLQKRVAWHQRGIMQYWPLVVAGIAAYPLNTYLINAANQDNITYVWPYVVGIVANLIGSVFVVESFGIDQTRMYLLSRRHEVAWINRNRDLIIALAGAVFGVVLTYLVDLWKG